MRLFICCTFHSRRVAGYRQPYYGNPSSTLRFAGYKRKAPDRRSAPSRGSRITKVRRGPAGARPCRRRFELRTRAFVILRQHRGVSERGSGEVRAVNACCESCESLPGGAEVQYKTRTRNMMSALVHRRVLFLIAPTGAYCREDRCQSSFRFELIPSMRPPMEECEAAGAVRAAGAEPFVIDAPADGSLGGRDARSPARHRPRSRRVGCDLRNVAA